MGQPVPNLPPLPDESPRPVLQAPASDPFHKIFLGPTGLRPGWRLFVYLALVATMYLLLGWLSYYLPSWGIRGIRIDLIVELGRLGFVVAIPTLLMARIEGRPFGAYGLPGRSAFGKLFWSGAVWGLAALTVLMLCMHWAGVFDFGSVVLHGRRLIKFAAFWAFLFLVVGLQEEMLIRGYPQHALTEALDFWPAAVVGSLAFGGIHFWNPGENWIGLTGAALIGLFFCLTLRRTGNLWFAVGFHASWDWGESFLYSVPDSGAKAPGHLLSSSFHGSPWLTGGSVGPEGSVFLFLVIALVWVAFDRMYRQAKYC
jgi:membrane protease YdiL (CAAX protease family)